MKISFGRVLALAAAPLVLLALGAGSAAAAPASGTPPPPSGFEAGSASFVSAQTGFVLGARGCSILPCKALLEKTVNGGKTWTRVPVPALTLVSPFSSTSATAVNSVVFANASDGWLYGPSLWATTNGGKHWHQVSTPGVVVGLVASDGVTFASVVPPNGGIAGSHLYRSTVSRGTWSLVPGVVPASDLTVSGHSAWVGIAPAMWTTTNSGRTWTKLSFRCPPSYPAASEVAAASPRRIAIACSNEGYPQPGFSTKQVYVSGNGGKTFRAVGQPPLPGQVVQLAMPRGRPQVITMTAASGASYLYQSVNGGKTWTGKAYYDGGLDFRDLAYVSATTGYVIRFSGGPVLAYGKGLMKTVNAGKTWTTVTMR